MATVTTPLRIGPADHGRTMTLDEFEEAEFEEGYRYELARGVLEVSEVPGEPHARDRVDPPLGDRATIIVTIPASSIGPAAVRSFGSGCPVMQSGRHPDVAVTLRNTPRIGEAFARASHGLRGRLEGSRGPRARLRDQAGGVPGLRPARILDRRSQGEDGDRARPRRRRLGRAGLPRRPAGPEPGPARLRHPRLGPLER